MDLRLLRLSLKAKEEPDLFGARTVEGQPVTREAWLRHVFGSEIDFRHYGTKFVYRPESEPPSTAQNLIFGWIGREKRRPERTPPAEGFEPTEHIGWEAVFALLDPTEHEDGQKIAIEEDHDIGEPKAILYSLVRKLNEDIHAPYSIQSFPIILAGSFWAFAAAHGNEIVSLKFDVAVPNMFNSTSDFQEELRSLRDKENVAKVETKLESDQLLIYNTNRITHHKLR